MIESTVNLTQCIAVFLGIFEPGGLLFGSGMAGSVVLLFVIAQAIRRYRRQRDVAALAHVEQAVRLNLPLTTMLDAASESETGESAARLRTLAIDLERGTPLAESLRHGLRSLSPRAVSLIDAAEQTGCLATQLPRVLEEERRMCHQQAKQEPLAVVYPVIVLSGLVGLLGYSVVFIAPKFVAIFEDFDIPLPAITTSVFAFGRDFGLMLMLLGGIGIMSICAAAAWQIANPKLDGPGITNLLQRIAWYVPVLHGVQRNRGLADLFDMLADTLEAGHPLPRAFDRAGTLAINPVLRGRVERWANLISRGTPVDDAARQVGMPNVAVGLLRTGQAAGNLPQVCRFLARYFRGRFNHVASLVRGAIVPFIVVVMAVLVGAVVLAFFMPLVRIIESAAASAL